MISNEPGTVLFMYKGVFDNFLHRKYGGRRHYHSFSKWKGSSSGTLTKKHSPLPRLLNPTLLDMRASGVLENALDENDLDVTKYDHLEDGQTKSLSMLQTYVIFGLYSLAIVVSLSLLLYEYLTRVTCK